MSAANKLLQTAASKVRDPQSGKSVWLAKMVEDAKLVGDTLEFVLRCSTDHSADDCQRIQTAIERHVAEGGFHGRVVCKVKGTRAPKKSAPKGDAVQGMSGPGMQAHGGPMVKMPIPGVKHVIAVASGKGGVGKSTVATNLAVAMHRLGLKVGMMDADIYGPSLPLMMKISGKPVADEQQKILPLQGYGVKCMSIGFLVPEGEPIIWRGPMVMGVVKQFLQDVVWGELDVLVIDLPPGTGDAQLTMIQTTPLSGAVIVTTPQDVALLDAVRGIEMFRKLDVPVLGIVENMSWLEVPGGDRMFPFGQGGGQRTAERYSVPLLAQIPLAGAIREGGDTGKPAALFDDDAGAAFFDVARTIREMLALA